MLNIQIPHAKSREKYWYNVRSNKIMQRLWVFVILIDDMKGIRILNYDQEFEIVYYIWGYD